MGLQRAHIVLPQDMVEQIDAAVGPRRRSAFLVATARTELRRRALLASCRMKPLSGGKKTIRTTRRAATCIQALRKESDSRRGEAVTVLLDATVLIDLPRGSRKRREQPAEMVRARASSGHDGY